MIDFRISTGNFITGGSCFIMHIPLMFYNSENPVTNQHNSEDTDEDISQIKMRIILADDDEDDRDLFKDALHELDAKTNLGMVKDGKSLIDLLNQTSILPDLIFLDLNMPYKSGKDCLVEIRNNDRLKNIPVIIYSTSSSPKDIEDTFELGANLYVKKPSSFNELTVCLKKLLTMDWNALKPHSIRNQYFFILKK